MTTIASTSDVSAAFEKRFYPFYLIYSAFYFFPLLFMGPVLSQMAASWWLLMSAQFVVFVGLYLMVGYWPSYQRYALGAMLLLATFGTLVTVGTSAIFPYVIFLTLFNLPLREARYWLAATGVALVAGCALTDWVWYFWGPALFASVINAVFALVEIKKRDAVAQGEVIHRIQERERIARDLHDVTGHQLTAIGLKAQLAKKLLAAKRYEEAETELEGIVQLAAQNRAAIRNVVEGELPENCQLVYNELMALLTAQHFDVSVQGRLPDITTRAAAEVSAIIGETLTNVLRHAEDTSVALSHNVSTQGYIMRVTNKAKKQSATRMGAGLKNLAHRAEQLGGKASFEIDPDGLATTYIQLPASVLKAHEFLK